MPKVAYVDVDDTLVRSAGTKRIPILTTVRHVKILKEEGWQLYCWSSGGGDYVSPVRGRARYRRLLCWFSPEAGLDDR